MAIDSRFIVNLKGKDYPTWAGVLDAATKAGLRSLTTELTHLMPLEKGGYFAIVKARAEFEDGRAFEDYGDAAPFNTSPQIATAAVRMASTRAKGRVLRDALNVGMTLLEELSDEDEAPAARSGRGQKAAVAQDPAPITCDAAGCNEVLTEEMVKACRKYWKTANYCHVHGRQMIAAGQVDVPQQKKSAMAEQSQSATG